jgi:hypothetical protein
MNLHHLTFEEILEICAVLEGPDDLKGMIESLVLLEKNIRYLRTSLEGKRLQDQLRESDKVKQQREFRKHTLRILKSHTVDKKE